jgi:hypothetical protein
MGAKAPSIPKYNPPTPPAYQPLDISNVSQQAISGDQAAYNLSDYEFGVQNPQLQAAQTAFQKQMLQDVTGNQPLPAGVQNEMMRGGLESAAQSMGATGAFGGGGGYTGGTGVSPSISGQMGPASNAAQASAGQSAVARNFGLNVANYLQQQKQIGTQELALGTSMFPRRDYGLGGQGIAQAMITENTNRNNYNWGVYGAQVQNAQFQENMAAQQAGLSAGASNANTSAMMGMGSSVIGAAGAAATAAAI